MKKNSIIKRLGRILSLLKWLWQTGYRLRQLDNVTQVEREHALREMGAACLKSLNVQIKTNNYIQTNGVLVVANHVSWLDIFVISALYPANFISKKEILQWPIIGKMVKNAGAVFIDRSNRKDVDVINAAIVQKLQQNRTVCFFPEARTSLGQGVLPLKAALFQSAINAQAKVLPVALKYYANNRRTEEVSFAEVNLLVSLWRIVSLPEIVVEVDCGEAFMPEGSRFDVKDKVEVFLRERVEQNASTLIE